MAYVTYDDVFEDLTYNRGNHTSNHDLVKTTLWFIKNLQETHTIPGDVLAKMMGIVTWYGEHHDLTDKQSTWLKIQLAKYQEHVDPMRAYA